MDLNKALDLIQNKLYSWLRELIRMLPNLILAALILVAGLFLSKLIKRLALKVIGRLSHGAVITNLLGSFIYVVCIGITLFAVLSVLRLDKAVTSILAGAGIAGLALAFAFQDIAANFMSGILITIRKPLRVGDIVKVKDYMGRVSNINLRDTVIQTFQGQMVIIPNKEVSQNPIENFSLLGKRRMDLTVGVSYGEDLEKVKSITLEAVKEIAGLSPTDTTTFFFTEFSDSSINFTIRIWAASPARVPAGSKRSHLAHKKSIRSTWYHYTFPDTDAGFWHKGWENFIRGSDQPGWLWTKKEHQGDAHGIRKELP
jgi:small-conductance mechanosensitive channel